MRKNIVLMTWKGQGNFGTCLQSYALYQILKSMGNNIKFLPYVHEHYTVATFFKWLLYILGVNKLREVFSYNGLSKQEKKRVRFQKRIFNDTYVYTKWQEKHLVSHTDCFITGSDQIWNTYHNYSSFFFLPFAGSCKRVAYASSIGTNSINEECKEEVRSLLLDFNHIGVREQEAVNVLSELTGRNDIVQVLDPTFLLNPTEWKKVAETAEYEQELPEEYILCYFIGNNSWYKEDLVDVQKQTGINNIVFIPAAENPNFVCENAIVYNNASPVEFVDLLQRAKLVCTDSFHATALSINHSVPFVEFLRFKDDDKKSQNSRIYDVLTHYGLNNRIYQKHSSIWKEPIDYRPVQEILSCDRKQSMDYLVNAIEN